MDLSHPPKVDSSTIPDRRATGDPRERLLGRVVACSGARATISAIAEEGGVAMAELWSVGKLVSISVGSSRIVALVYSMSTPTSNWQPSVDNVMNFEVELVGEIRSNETGQSIFSAGISNYPHLGAIAHRIRTADLAAIYADRREEAVAIGRLTQDDSMDASIHIPSMLSRHFAVVGTTGVGKSSAVSLLVSKAIQTCPDLRVLILDPHNEFAAAFPDTAIVIEPETLDLPFWLFRLEEFTEVIYRGRPGVPEEIDVLRDLIPEAKRAFRGNSDTTLFRPAQERASLTADTPVPYRMADLLALIDERIGRLEGRNEKPYLRTLKTRIASALSDPRFRFMFSASTINDTIVDTLSHVFRIPGQGRPISCFQLAGIPSEVVNSVASVLCRMAFEIALWSGGATRLLVLCEEAHRYVPSDASLGFTPTRRAIARIAKEGRKYGISLGVVTQRPGELDPTILSQCSTVFAMRLANDRDQEIIRSAIAHSSSSTTSFLSSIGNREAIAFGEAVAVPMRMMFSEIPENMLPRTGCREGEEGSAPTTVDLRAIVRRMRNAAGETSFPAAPQPGDDAGSFAAGPTPQRGDAAAGWATTASALDQAYEPSAGYAASARDVASTAHSRHDEPLARNEPRDPTRASLFRKSLGNYNR